MTKAEKQAYVTDLVNQLRTANAAVLTEYRGTTVAEMEQLRSRLYEQGINYRVAKNTLVKRALNEVGIELTDETILDHPLAFASGAQDEVTLAKAITSVNKEFETIIPVAGIVQGSFVTRQVIEALSKLPSREELYSKLVGSMASLPTRLAYAVAYPVQGLVTTLKHVQAKKET